MKQLWKAVFFMAIAHQVMSLALTKATEKKKMVCYYGSWAVYRPGNGKFDVENIDPFLCTHIVYGFAGLALDNTINVLDPYNDLKENWGKGAYLRFTGLKKKNPDLKALIAVGGWNEGSERYSQMAADPAKRTTFVNSVVNFLITYGFDGLDFDWEYPSNRGGSITDKINFVHILRELKAAFVPYGFLLTAAVSSGKSTIDSAYDIPAVASALDQIHVMAYDYHGAWETLTGLNAPLYANPTIESGSNLLLNVNWTVNYWISNGAPPSKIILGMGLYGRGFTLASSTQNGFYAYAPQPIQAGPYTRESGTWGYNEICEKFKADPSWTVVRDPYYKAPYAYKSNQWIGYDDQQSLRLKAEYAMSMNLGGSMVWSIETDDFRGLCHNVPFILIKTITESMNGPIVIQSTTSSTSAPVTTKATTTVSPVTTKATTTAAPVTNPPTASPTVAPAATTTLCGPQNPTTTASAYTTTPPIKTTAGTPPPNTLCKSEGLNPDPYDCGIFYTCLDNGLGGWTVYMQRCATGTAFSDELNTCTFPNQVPGCETYSG
uniref:chitinase n=1 Tax=Daphnia magna TaxID=35525 RepID=A0A0P5TL21_9CRUS